MILATLSLVAAALVQQADTTRPLTAIVVRHAEKASQTERDPVLSAEGTARAAALDSALAHARVTAVIVTPYKRNIETAAAVARRFMLTPIVVPVEGGVAAHAYAVARAARAQGGVVLIVGHSNTVLPIVRALGGPTLPDLCDPSYAQIFTLTVQPNTPTAMVRSQYGTADPPAASSCPVMTPQ